jgi:23S rRNA pseudouridine1911/1915/1917 synthase
LKLRSGDVIHVFLPENQFDTNPLAEEIPLSIIFEDEHVLVIDKPPGLVVHPGAGVHNGTLVNAVLFHCGSTLPSLGNAGRAGIVHRLDRDTSGVMVVAKSQVALTGLSEQFAKHEQTRRYHALCFSSLSDSSLTIESGYGRDPNHRTRFAMLNNGEGKRACTRVRTLKTFIEESLSLVECELETGRTHQIRVHLSAHKCPIVGDPVYGRTPQHFGTKFPKLHKYIQNFIERQMLHAVTLGFNHPATSKYMEFHSHYRNDMKELICNIDDLSQNVDLT